MFCKSCGGAVEDESSQKVCTSCGSVQGNSFMYFSSNVRILKNLNFGYCVLLLCYHFLPNNKYSSQLFTPTCSSFLFFF